MTETKPPRLLVVDDEVELKNALCETLADEGYDTAGAGNGAEGLALLRSRDFDQLLCDLMMPGMDGITVLKKAREIDPTLVGVIMTGQGTISSAVEAMKVGAFDYVLKPFDLQTMRPILARALDVRQLRTENVRLRQILARLQYESPRYQMIGTSPAMKRVVGLIEKVAPMATTVLVRGESGTGKELVARALHHNSPRRDRPLVTINCAALQEALLESELFGHEKGSFTGAQQSKAGLFEVAEGGTLFVDEVAEMAPSLQAKLLRVLEDGHFRRVGGTKEHHASVRVIAATNKPLEEEQKAGRFREDLYYRLNVVTIEIPPLRQRREDIPALVEHLLNTRPIGRTPWRVDPAAMQSMLNYSWPGNIRELANVLERAQILAEEGVITPDDLPETVFAAPQAVPPADEGTGAGRETLNLTAMERRTVRAALEQVRGNKVQAAKLLGVSRRALYRLLTRYNLEAVPEA